jgi:hypothetical protein
MCVRRASKFSSRGLLDGSSNSCTLPVAQGDHLRIFIELRSHGARGPRYRVRMNKPDGMVLIGSTTEPLFDVARFLMSKGITGKIEMWDGIRAFPRMRGDIERLAGLTVSEGKDRTTLRRYVERTASGDFELEASDIEEIGNGRPWRVRKGPA